MKKPSPVSDLFETPTGTALSYIFMKIFYVMNTNCQVVTGVNCYSNNCNCVFFYFQISFKSVD